MPSIISAGTTTGSALSLTSDTSGELQIRTNNGSTTAMTLTTGGNVGVGTSSPAYKLHTVGTVAASNNGSENLYLIDTTNVSRASLQVSGAVNYFNTNIDSATQGQFIWRSSNAYTERMRITDAGNVGIGTSSPTAKLNVSGGNIRLDNNQGVEFGGANNYIYGNETTDFIALATNGNERMRIDSSGNVGIGLTSFNQKLTIGGINANNNTNQNSIEFQDNNGNPNFRLTGGRGANGNEGYGVFSTLTGGTMTERMRIDSSGRLLIGATSPANNSYKVTVSNAAAGGIVVNATGAGDANFYSTSTGILYHFYAESTTAKFYVENGGTIYSTNTSVQAISDVRHKENVKDLETGLSEVMALKPRRFDWKEGKGTGEKNVAGFIAQEVEYVLPDLIGDWKEELNTDTTFKSLAMGNMIPTLVKAIQELNAKVDAQAARIAALESK